MEAAFILKPIYIAPDFTARSGVSTYARLFFEHVLKPIGFEHRQFTSLTDFESWYVSEGHLCRFHLEIAVGTHFERAILWRLLEAGAVVDITLHDAPYIAFPYYQSEYRWINQLSKLGQCVLPQLFFGLHRVRRIRNIYTLSKKGRDLTARAYPGTHVVSIPHVSVPRSTTSSEDPLTLIYTGFIGKKKGLRYALELHQALIKEFPTLTFKVVGAPVDEISRNYLKMLSEKYHDQVEYMGYVDDAKFMQLLSAGHIVMLPTQDYGTICPVSGNIINALTAGSVVVTSRANANEELIEDGISGRFLTGCVDDDVQMIAGLVRDPSLRGRMIEHAQASIAENNCPQRLMAMISP